MPSWKASLGNMKMLKRIGGYREKEICNCFEVNNRLKMEPIITVYAVSNLWLMSEDVCQSDSSQQAHRKLPEQGRPLLPYVSCSPLGGCLHLIRVRAVN